MKAAHTSRAVVGRCEFAAAPTSPPRRSPQWQHLNSFQKTSGRNARRAFHRLAAGDLTDSKGTDGASRQEGREWAAYRRLVAALVAAGVDEDRIFDTRGNHDSFNVPQRGSASDLYAAHSVQGQRSGAHARAYSHLLHALPPRGCIDNASGKGGANRERKDEEGGGGRDGESGAAGGGATSDHRQQKAKQAEQAEREADGDLSKVGATCPALALLGIDASFPLGAKGPINFVGACVVAWKWGVCIHGLVRVCGRGAAGVFGVDDGFFFLVRR